MQRFARFMLATMLLAAGPPAVLGTDVAGVQVPETAQVGGKDLVLNGVGLRLATLLKVKVYVMGLYLEEKSADPKAIMASTGNKRISMDFVHEVSADQLRGGWQEGFDKNFAEKDAVKAEIEQFNAAMSDVSKGDRIVLDFNGSAVEVQVKGSKAATIDNAKFQQAVLSIWLGSKPPNREIKDGILGKD